VRWLRRAWRQSSPCLCWPDSFPARAAGLGKLMDVRDSFYCLGLFAWLRSSKWAAILLMGYFIVACCWCVSAAGRARLQLSRRETVMARSANLIDFPAGRHQGTIGWADHYSVGEETCSQQNETRAARKDARILRRQPPEKHRRCLRRSMRGRSRSYPFMRGRSSARVV